MSMHKYGWRPDLPDVRDLKYESVTAKLLPQKTSLRRYCSPIEDQGQLGSCTGNALVGCLELLERMDGKPQIDLSRLFCYYNARLLEGTTQEDSGATIRDVVKGAVKYGVCAEQIWRYDIAQFALRPSKETYSQAKRNLITEYRRVTGLTAMKTAIASGYALIIGISIYDSFESQEVARTGIVPMPGVEETLLGGHAVAVIGYNDATKRFECRNSWGTGWGDAGYFTIPYAYLTNDDLAADCWCIIRDRGF